MVLSYSTDNTTGEEPLLYNIEYYIVLSLITVDLVLPKIIRIVLLLILYCTSGSSPVVLLLCSHRITGLTDIHWSCPVVIPAQSCSTKSIVSRSPGSITGTQYNISYVVFLYHNNIVFNTEWIC